MGQVSFSVCIILRFYYGIELPWWVWIWAFAYTPLWWRDYAVRVKREGNDG